MTQAGSNTKLSDEDRQKLFAHHFRIELAAETKRRAAAAEKTANRKIAKGYDPTFTGQKSTITSKPTLAMTIRSRLSA
jgi:hypothetical protein